MRSKKVGLGPKLIVAALLATACGAATTDQTSVQSTSATSSTVAVETSTTSPNTTEASEESLTTTSAPVASTTSSTSVPVDSPAQDLEILLDERPDLDEWTLEPGRYRSDRLLSSVGFQVGAPVTMLDISGLLAFKGADDAIAVLLDTLGVVPAADAGIHPPHDSIIPDNMEPVPANLATWFQGATQIVVAEEGLYDETQIKASYWDVAVDPNGGGTFPCDLGSCVAFVINDDLGAIVLGDEFQFRIYQLEGSGTGLLMFVQARPAQFLETVVLAESILSNLSVES